MLVVLLLLIGAGVAFWLATRGRRKKRPERWLVSNTHHGKVYATPWFIPPLMRVRELHDRARKERVPEDAPDIFDEIRWYIVEREHLDEVGRFPVPWRGGVVFTEGWTVRSQLKTALSPNASDDTIIKEVWNSYGVYHEDDPLS